MLDDEAMKFIAGVSSLRYLIITCCHRVTDAGIEHLARLPQLETLRLVELTGLTPKSAQIISEIRNLKQLAIFDSFVISGLVVVFVSHFRHGAASLQQTKVFNFTGIGTLQKGHQSWH